MSDPHDVQTEDGDEQATEDALERDETEELIQGEPIDEETEPPDESPG